MHGRGRVLMEKKFLLIRNQSSLFQSRLLLRKKLLLNLLLDQDQRYQVIIQDQVMVQVELPPGDLNPDHQVILRK